MRPFEALLRRVADDCLSKIKAAPDSPAKSELRARSAALLESLRAPTPFANRAEAIVTGAAVHALATEVFGRVDPSVETLRAALQSLRAEKETDPDDGARSQQARRPLSAEPGTVVDGRYAVEKELGRGAMGVVYLARDLGLGRSVALKLLLEGDDDALAAETFRREATTLASIRNAHVVQVHAFGTYEGAYFLALEHVAGSSLEDILVSYARAGERLPVVRAISILRQIADGLTAVHEVGIVHRDVKPANVVVEERTGRPVIIDFGLAVSQKDDGAIGAYAGTPHYMAPEQVSGAKILTPQTDLYALGCMAYELLCGRTPFQAPTIAELLQLHRHQAPVAPSVVRPGLVDFDPVILRALAKDPRDRHVSCLDFVAELDAAHRVFDAPGPTLPPPPPGSETGYARGVIRVTAIDDDPMVRQIYSRCAIAAFGAERLDMRVASSGADALERAALEMSDLVLLDYAMPGLDGVDTLARLRALPDGNRARVIVVSAATDTLPRWRFASLGVTDFLGKPVRIAPFIELLREVAADAGWLSPSQLR